MSALVIGLGNPDRGDDGVGRQVVRVLASDGTPARVVELDDPAEALALWAPADTVVVADAVRSGAAPGTVRVVDVTGSPLATGSWASGGTHALGLAAVVELARALGRMPRRLVVVGVEAARLDHGERMSPAVRAAVPTAVRAVRAQLAEAEAG